LNQWGLSDRLFQLNRCFHPALSDLYLLVLQLDLYCQRLRCFLACRWPQLTQVLPSVLFRLVDQLCRAHLHTQLRLWVQCCRYIQLCQYLRQVHQCPLLQTQSLPQVLLVLQYIQ
jgi:hypothetical protein